MTSQKTTYWLLLISLFSPHTAYSPPKKLSWTEQAKECIHFRGKDFTKLNRFIETFFAPIPTQEPAASGASSKTRESAYKLHELSLTENLFFIGLLLGLKHSSIERTQSAQTLMNSLCNDQQTPLFIAAHGYLEGLGYARFTRQAKLKLILSDDTPEMVQTAYNQSLTPPEESEAAARADDSDLTGDLLGCIQVVGEDVVIQLTRAAALAGKRMLLASPSTFNRQMAGTLLQEITSEKLPLISPSKGKPSSAGAPRRAGSKPVDYEASSAAGSLPPDAEKAAAAEETLQALVTDMILASEQNSTARPAQQTSDPTPGAVPSAGAPGRAATSSADHEKGDAPPKRRVQFESDVQKPSTPGILHFDPRRLETDRPATQDVGTTKRLSLAVRTTIKAPAHTSSVTQPAALPLEPTSMPTEQLPQPPALQAPDASIPVQATAPASQAIPPPALPTSVPAAATKPLTRAATPFVPPHHRVQETRQPHSHGPVPARESFHHQDYSSYPWPMRHNVVPHHSHQTWIPEYPHFPAYGYAPGYPRGYLPPQSYQGYGHPPQGPIGYNGIPTQPLTPAKECPFYLAGYEEGKLKYVSCEEMHDTMEAVRTSAADRLARYKKQAANPGEQVSLYNNLVSQTRGFIAGFNEAFTDHAFIESGRRSAAGAAAEAPKSTPPQSTVQPPTDTRPVVIKRNTSLPTTQPDPAAADREDSESTALTQKLTQIKLSINRNYKTAKAWVPAQKREARDCAPENEWHDYCFDIGYFNGWEANCAGEDAAFATNNLKTASTLAAKYGSSINDEGLDLPPDKYIPPSARYKIFKHLGMLHGYCNASQYKETNPTSTATIEPMMLPSQYQCCEYVAEKPAPPQAVGKSGRRPSDLPNPSTAAAAAPAPTATASHAAVEHHTPPRAPQAPPVIAAASAPTATGLPETDNENVIKIANYIATITAFNEKEHKIFWSLYNKNKPPLKEIAAIILQEKCRANNDDLCKYESFKKGVRKADKNIPKEQIERVVGDNIRCMMTAEKLGLCMYHLGIIEGIKELYSDLIERKSAPDDNSPPPVVRRTPAPHAVAAASAPATTSSAADATNIIEIVHYITTTTAIDKKTHKKYCESYREKPHLLPQIAAAVLKEDSRANNRLLNDNLAFKGGAKNANKSISGEERMLWAVGKNIMRMMTTEIPGTAMYHLGIIEDFKKRYHDLKVSKPAPHVVAAAGAPVTTTSSAAAPGDDSPPPAARRTPAPHVVAAAGAPVTTSSAADATNVREIANYITTTTAFDKDKHGAHCVRFFKEDLLPQIVEAVLKEGSRVNDPSFKRHEHFLHGRDTVSHLLPEEHIPKTMEKHIRCIMKSDTARDFMYRLGIIEILKKRYHDLQKAKTGKAP